MKTTMQCDRCGGEMILSEDGLRAKCPYCNHQILFRSPKGEALLLSLARANALRRDSRFSDAIREYRIITEENPEDAEAFWGLVLSTYGIEYVKDRRTGRYIPTCHRAVRQSILENDDYLRAIGTATEEQRADYTVQANEIDRLQKDILRRTERAEDFDVFISFKSTDDYDNPTRDARIARTIYDELTRRGFKTFFSDVTLNDALFNDYEPIIFRALYSCKFFILVATRPEYVDAAWVKNEWSRFEQRMEEEKLSGVACAVFDGKEVRELPPFLRAQGIDLSRHAAGGYEVLLADAIERKLGKSEKSKNDEELRRQIEEQKRQQAAIEERLASMGGGSVKNFLIRAEQMLRMNKTQDALDYYTRALDAKPDCAEAWWGLFLMEMKGRKEDELLPSLDADLLDEIRENDKYKNAVEYASGEFARRVKDFQDEIFNGERWWEAFLEEMGEDDEDGVVDILDVSVLEEIRSSKNLKLADEFADDALKEKLTEFFGTLYTETMETLYPAEVEAREESLERYEAEKKQFEEKEKSIRVAKYNLKKERDELTQDRYALQDSKEMKKSKESTINPLIFLIIPGLFLFLFPFALVNNKKIKKSKAYVADEEQRNREREISIVLRERELEKNELDLHRQKDSRQQEYTQSASEQLNQILTCLYFMTESNEAYQFEEKREEDYEEIARCTKALSELDVIET